MTDICIAHGGDIGEPNGGTDRVSAIATQLTNQGHDVTLVVPSPSEGISDRFDDVSLETLALPTHGVSSQPKRAYHISKRAIELAEKEDAILQFEHSTLAGVGTLHGADEFVLDMHDLAFRSPLYGDLPLGTIVQRIIGRLEKRAIERAATIAVVSERMKEIITDRWGISADVVSVIPNGYFEGRVEPYRQAEPVEGQVVFLGTLHPKLDVQEIRDIAQLSEVSEFVVIGDGNKYEDLVRASKEIEALSVTGRLPDDEAFEIVASSEVAVNPQHQSELQETSSPVKLYYYAALGVPTVATAGPELASHLEHKDAAKLVSPGGSFASAVRQILMSEEKRDMMSNNAERVAQKCTWRKRGDRFAALYD